MRVLRRKKKRIIKMAADSFDTIYSSCKKIADSYKSEHIPLATYKHILSKAKLRKEKKDLPYITEFVDQYNDVLNKMLIASEKEAGKLKSKVVPIQYIQIQCELVQKKIKEGYDTHPDNKRPDKKA